MRIATMLLGLLLSLSCLVRSAWAQTLTTEEVVERSLPSIVTIDAEDKSSTGFIANNLVYTCFHVMAGSKGATVTFHDGTKAPVLGAVAADGSAESPKDLATPKHPRWLCCPKARRDLQALSL